MLNEGNQIHNFISSSASGTVINHGSGSGTDFFTSYGSDSGSGSTSQKVTAPPFPVPQRCIIFIILDTDLNFLVEWILITDPDLDRQALAADLDLDVAK
jgi:hypothetical protein